MASLFSETEAPPPSTREALDGEERCCICMVNVPDTWFTQCHTKGFCADCVNRILQERMQFPLCRAVVSEAIPPEEDESGYESEQYDVPVSREEPRSEPQGRSREETDAILRRFNDLVAELGEVRSDLSVL
jgi:hypothetical protein